MNLKIKKSIQNFILLLKILYNSLGDNLKHFKFILVSVLLNLIFVSSVFALTGYTDVSKNSWYFNIVTDLSSKGIIRGYKDGSFMPDNNLTYREFIILINNLLSKESDNNIKSSYKTLNSYSSFKSIVNSDDFITREEAAKYLSIALEKVSKIPPDYSEYKFSDNSSISYENLDFVYNMANYKILKGNEKNEFNPKDLLKRSEAAAIIYNVNNFIKNSNIKDIDIKVNSFLDKWTKDNISENMSDEEKVRAIHDFIVKRNDYNYEALTKNLTDDSKGFSVFKAESILFGDGGVCNSYAELFEIMAHKAGLDVKYVPGIARSKRGNGTHAWNMVKVSGSWYHIDTTWDDPIGRDDLLYLFYLRGDDFLNNARYWFRQGNPAAKSDYKTDRTSIVNGRKTDINNIILKDGIIIFN